MRLYECTNVRTVSIDLSRYVHMYSLLTMPVSPQNPMINDRSHFNIRIAKCFFFCYFWNEFTRAPSEFNDTHLVNA